MLRNAFPLGVTIAVTASLAFALACSQHRGGSNGLVLPDGIEPLEQRIAASPKVGDLFPDVTIADDQGRPVNIRSLAAEKPYTVLTLGCLT